VKWRVARTRWTRSAALEAAVTNVKGERQHGEFGGSQPEARPWDERKVGRDCVLTLAGAPWGILAGR